MNADKLAKLQSQVRIGGKGSARRKVKRTNGGGMGGDDKKLAAVVKQLNVHPLSNIQEVNMFADAGKVLHFASPRVFATEQPNTFVINGPSTTKDVTELVPGILNQLGPDSLASLRKLAETYQSMNPEQAEGDDEIPDLVENFDTAEISEKAEE